MARGPKRAGMVGAGMAERRRTKGTAPSAGNIEALDKFEPSAEARAHEPSTVDAMGQDKRRQVVGHTYGPSARSRIMFFLTVGAVLALTVGQAPDALQGHGPGVDHREQPGPGRPAERRTPGSGQSLR